LDSDPSIHVIGSAETAERALPLLTAGEPMVAVVDYRLPGMNGLDLCREIAERRLRTQVVVLSASVDRTVEQHAMFAGARGFVGKDADTTQIKSAVFAAARRQTTIDVSASGRATVIDGFFGSNLTPALRPAHLAVLKMMVAGMSNAEIAGRSGLSMHTVKQYAREIYERLGATGRSEAVALAVRRRIL
jgi:DNA-binding NarL/FixJ family response regulator